MSASADLARELARFFAANPGALERLRRQHRPGPDGRCRKCRAGGDGSGAVRGCVLGAMFGATAADSTP